jgi:hypothetical protein
MVDRGGGTRGEGGSVHVEVEETAPIGSTGEMLGE